MLSAFKNFGVAFPSPLPQAALDSGLRMTLRGTYRLDLSIGFMGRHTFTNKDMLQIQRFHRAVLCWESDRNIASFKPQTALISPEDWIQSSNGAYYFIFPVFPESNLTLQHPDKKFTPPKLWSSFLRDSANEAQTLIRKTSSCHPFCFLKLYRKYDCSKVSVPC